MFDYLSHTDFTFFVIAFVSAGLLGVACLAVWNEKRKINPVTGKSPAFVNLAVKAQGQNLPKE